MKRNWDMNEVSDGKKYYSNDMVRVGCSDCAGCSACCHGMGESIVLDPYDIFRLSSHLKTSFEGLMASCLELKVVDGLILPNLKMMPETGACHFLNEEGRCRIHAARPGICRLFPMGRIYEQDSFAYFLQVHECPQPNKTKVKLSKWLDTPNLKTYERYILQWHQYLKKQEAKAMHCQTQEEMKAISMQLLQTFYLTPYDLQGDFYEQFAIRLAGGLEE